VPANPTYTKDVQFILGAHCVRCHGANDKLNPMPYVTTPSKMPLTCYFQSYGDTGDCTTVGSTTCHRGAAYCATMIPIFIGKGATYPMPPSPSDQLTDWENEVLTTWSHGNPPAM
jgi:hypothetical protein